MAFEAEDLTYLDSAISLSNKYTLRELILGLNRLLEENKNEIIFILVEKDYKGNIILLYKKKFYKDASTIADYLLVVMTKQHEDSIISIFKLYY
jgi:hypothetical protein